MSMKEVTRIFNIVQGYCLKITNSDTLRIEFTGVDCEEWVMEITPKSIIQKSESGSNIECFSRNIENLFLKKIGIETYKIGIDEYFNSCGLEHYPFLAIFVYKRDLEHENTIAWELNLDCFNGGACIIVDKDEEFKSIKEQIFSLSAFSYVDFLIGKISQKS